ncbi:tryptophan--tRNA ligase [Paenibacillus terrigena]|uniref:tryptophan--tRNA ligase n=1 Tax=Paenibacillus terrigena TaxID=369333 RepID=UPI0028D4257A|nr:tryptophan--tRNA ligase [Paenibacillus terrigena]
MTQERVLTGDRTTGRLHLGHYAGSLQNRVQLQHQYDTFIMLADVQALTTHFDRPEMIREHVREVALDYLAVGIDPEHANIFIQSMIPEIAELTVFFSMFVKVNHLRHNPTIKAESRGGSFDELYYGFLGYPISQTADITFCKATIIPVGEDQLPHLESSRYIVRRFNELYGSVFPEPQALLSKFPRLIGLDGNAKMSKSLGNAIALSASNEEITLKVRKAVTDPARIHKNDPGHPERCPIYHYHQAFRADEAAEIHAACEQGTIGCKECKHRITNTLQDLLGPMRERRAAYEAMPAFVDAMLQHGTERARGVARHTMEEVREVMGIQYFK